LVLILFKSNSSWGVEPMLPFSPGKSLSGQQAGAAVNQTVAA
jgi:hypothetical protein